MEKFLKRPIYDANTMTYRFEDGSGIVPKELRTEMQICASGPEKGSWLRAWTARWDWNKRLKRIIEKQTEVFGFKVKLDPDLKEGEWYFLDESGKVSDKMWEGKSSLTKEKLSSFLEELGDGLEPAP